MIIACKLWTMKDLKSIFLCLKFKKPKYGQLYIHFVPAYKMYPNICPRQVAIHNTNFNALLVMVKLSKMSNKTNNLHILNVCSYEPLTFLLYRNIGPKQFHSTVLVFDWKISTSVFLFMLIVHNMHNTRVNLIKSFWIILGHTNLNTLIPQMNYRLKER